MEGIKNFFSKFTSNSSQQNNKQENNNQIQRPYF